MLQKTFREIYKQDYSLTIWEIISFILALIGISVLFWGFLGLAYFLATYKLY